MKKIDLWKINPRLYENKLISPEEVLEWFKSEDAYWAYEGDPSPEKPHAELSSGLCSDGFFDCLRVLKYPNIAEILGRQAARRLLPIFQPEPDKTWVISSAYAAITFGHEVAKAFSAIFMNTEKDPADPKKQIWQRMTVPPDCAVLQAEELITTSGTFKEVLRAVNEGNATKPMYYTPVVALVHRPSELPMEYDGRMVVAVIEKAIKNYKPEECPYCKAGSPRYRPKTHWAELTGKK
jgi:orotate phosphoribosyltransferase